MNELHEKNSSRSDGSGGRDTKSKVIKPPLAKVSIGVKVRSRVRRKFGKIYRKHMALPIPVRPRYADEQQHRKSIPRYGMSRSRVYLPCVIFDSARARLCTYVRVLCYRTKAKNQYDITLRPASSRLVTEISGKTGRDELVKVSFTWHRSATGSAFIFGPPVRRVRRIHRRRVTAGIPGYYGLVSFS